MPISGTVSAHQLEWGRKNRILNDWCTKVGRSPAAIERSAFIADEFSQAPIKDMRPHYDTLEAYVATGANHIYYGLGAPYDLAPIEALLQVAGSARQQLTSCCTTC